MTLVGAIGRRSRRSEAAVTAPRFAHRRRRFNDRQLFALLRREGEVATLNRVYRLHPAEGRTHPMTTGDGRLAWEGCDALHLTLRLASSGGSRGRASTAMVARREGAIGGGDARAGRLHLGDRPAKRHRAEPTVHVAAAGTRSGSKNGAGVSAHPGAGDACDHAGADCSSGEASPPQGGEHVHADRNSETERRRPARLVRRLARPAAGPPRYASRRPIALDLGDVRRRATGRPEELAVRTHEAVRAFTGRVLKVSWCASAQV